MKSLSGVDGLPRIEMIQEIINGKAGYHLKIGSSRYKVELQKPLGSDEGTPVSCKPDFFISPSILESLKPIAIFCDGWKYHKDITDEDALKETHLSIAVVIGCGP